MTPRSIDETCEALAARIEALDKLSAAREDWTKERFSQMKIAVDTALATADRAAAKAEQATEKRFEGIDEFRRAEYDVQHRALLNVVKELSERFTGFESSYRGRSGGQADTVKWLFAGLLAGGGLVAMLEFLLR